ncbi:hypothetical protein SAMN04487910_0342 [Aquimarina amphilecti]|uniref:Outer membrane protein beta-barrel domain-containing protein n=1 Tax=Aquimarina amphilecti TaxID=1038014 RepID=A0A1H7GD75_AQUAM|nr:hypothetical protein [Aquimarina amphilecti]SEK36071.1 hypothetical protein SAMN04487910_0342 [Aquimarina amphilecti]
MKKLFFVLILIVTSINLQAQDIPKNTIGIRLSEGVVGDEGFGPEITYQRQMFGEHNRIDVNLSWKTNSFINTYRGGAYFHWSYNIWDNLNWFAGPGIGAGYVDFKSSIFGFGISNDRDSEFFPYVGADFGVDYRFDFPLQVAFSIRPTYDIHSIENSGGFSDVDNFGVNVGIAARYIF